MLWNRDKPLPNHVYTSHNVAKVLCNPLRLKTGVCININYLSCVFLIDHVDRVLMLCIFVENSFHLSSFEKML